MTRPFLAAVIVLGLAATALCQAAERDADLADVLSQAGEQRRGELIAAMETLPEAERASVRFLLLHMPEHDLRSLPIDLLVENVRLSHLAMAAAPWRADVPEQVFLNDVLPYVNINERRENWRKGFHDRFAPHVADAKTTSEAAAILNNRIFAELNVRYSRNRPKADQSPAESIAAGTASCTGLSIILADACRAVGVPARLVGVIWQDGSGNHTWVEVYDRGKWRFTGAAEPTGDALDQAWFTGRAAQAPLDHPLHSIYAVSYRTTDVKFILPWAPRVRDVSAVNVTANYRPQPQPAQVAPHLTSAEAMAALSEYLAKPERDGRIDDRPFAHASLSRDDAAAATDMLWRDHADATRRDRAAEIDRKRVTLGELVMRYDYRVYGEKPEGGRSLYISMHGGGGAPPEVNDRQWRNQITLYKPAEGVYLAPRAPTDTWNLWHQGHIDAMFDRLIADMIVAHEVNPDRVYLMGYSAGGDGVYQLAPRMADRFAAASMMAGHPNESTPEGLRNLPFSIQVGGNDAAYSRNAVARKWGDRLAELRTQDPEGYEHLVKVYDGKGHWMDGEDAIAVPWMAKHTRDAMPTRIVWKQDDVLSSRFYWLAVADADRIGGSVVTAVRDGQAIRIESEQVKRITVRLHDRMLDMDQPVTIVFNGRQVFSGSVPRKAEVIARTLAGRGDPRSAYFGEVTVEAAAP